MSIHFICALFAALVLCGSLNSQASILRSTATQPATLLGSNSVAGTTEEQNDRLEKLYSEKVKIEEVLSVHYRPTDLPQSKKEDRFRSNQISILTGQLEALDREIDKIHRSRTAAAEGEHTETTR